MDKRITTWLTGVIIGMTPVWLYAQTPQPATGSTHATADWRNESFILERTGYGISTIKAADDHYGTNFVRRGRVFGDVNIRYRPTGTPGASLDSQSLSHPLPAAPLQVTDSFDLKGPRLAWTINLSNTGSQPLRIEDLAIPLPYNSGGGEDPKEIFEQHVVKHHFISGNNSFIFWERPTGVGPYLVMVPLPGTSLEYFSTVSPGEARGVFRAYIHSANIVHTIKGSSPIPPHPVWRQPNTSLVLPKGGRHTYGFVFRWAKDYAEIRNILVEEGGIDIEVMPGMTVPNNLEVQLALRTRRTITSITPEFPGATTIKKMDRPGSNTHFYKVQFNRLGENKLVVTYGPNYKTQLEFFVTEPLETLYKKRAAFIVNRQQHKDPSKWYDGLFSVYDMKNHVLRGPDNPDYFDTSRLRYVLTCDDPALCKAPFVAAKNVYYPDAHEIAAVEYYIEHFVWGGLQRTDKEQPYPYGVYGTPSWKVNRNADLRRANTDDRNKDKIHVWRSYDYPHIMMLYYEMYKIAKMYPGLTHYLDAKGYLERARQTARAFFTYPYEILPWYETYKWGCYNELLLIPLMADLEKEGFHDDAEWLRHEWEKKVKYFLYDDPYPFRSEYAIDATAFESSHALAKYAMLNTLQPDSNLWYDKNLKRWYSHPHIDKKDAVTFMDRQIQANIALRGSIEPDYYYLGSDFRGRSDGFTLTYMSQMGGWSILDYALHFAAHPDSYLRLGYASYLSAFALINSGTPASNYGFWYPGKDNDGASGWAFESQQYIDTWIKKPQDRGPWFYDGETDLGYGGATRAAATVVTRDSVFGLVAYGGTLTTSGSTWSVIPKDGLRRRLFYRADNEKIDLELDRDGFAAGQPVVFDRAARTITFQVENRSGDAHTLEILINGHSQTFSIPAGRQTTLHIRINK